MSRWESLLVVQEHDTRADQLAHRIETLPARAELAKLEDAGAALDRQLTDVQRRRDELARSQQRVDAERSELAGQRDQLDADAQRLRAELAESESELAAELGEVRAERAAAAKSVPDELWTEYDELRSRLGGGGVPPLSGATCPGRPPGLSAGAGGPPPQ